MTTEISGKGWLVVVTLAIGGTFLISFLGFVGAPMFADWQWPPPRPRRGGLALWPVLTGVGGGGVLGFLGGTALGKYLVSPAKNL